MRKFTITCCSLFIISCASGQVKMGSVLLGGNISYTNQESELSGNFKQEQKVVSFSPSIGTAVKENLILGIDILYAQYKSENIPSNQMDEVNNIGGGIFLRQYKSISNSFLLFGNARLGYTNLNREYGSNTNPEMRTTAEGSNINLSLMPGISYKAGKRLMLELALNNLLEIEYEEQTSVSPSFGGIQQASKQNFFAISTSAGSIPLNLGVRYLFSK